MWDSIKKDRLDAFKFNFKQPIREFTKTRKSEIAKKDIMVLGLNGHGDFYIEINGKDVFVTKHAGLLRDQAINHFNKL